MPTTTASCQEANSWLYPDTTAKELMHEDATDPEKARQETDDGMVAATICGWILAASPLATIARIDALISDKDTASR